MKEKDSYRDPFLKDKLADFRAEPPVSVWNELEARLAAGRARSRRLVVLWATAASVALAISLGIYLGQEGGPEQEEMAREVRPVQLEADDLVDTAEEEASGAASTAAEPSGTGPEARDGQPDPVQGDDSQIGRPQDEAHRGEGSGRKKGPEEKLVKPVIARLNEGGDAAAGDQDSEGSGLATEQQALVPINVIPEPSDPWKQLLPEEYEAQDVDIAMEQPRDPAWYIGAGMSPLYSYRQVDPVAPGTEPDYESGLLAYSAGVTLAYNPVSRLQVESGLFYNRTGINIGEQSLQVYGDRNAMVLETYQKSVPLRVISNSVGNIVLNSGEVHVNSYKIGEVSGAAPAQIDNQFSEPERGTVNYTQHLDYLEWPLNLRYAVVDRKLGLQVLGGVSANFLVGNYLTAEGANGPVVGYMANLRRVNYSGNAGVAMVYKIGEQFQLNLEPRFRYFLNSVNDESLPLTRPWSLGFYTGLNFRF